jgi:endonuclease YncB( thermonuclease family)
MVCRILATVFLAMMVASPVTAKQPKNKDAELQHFTASIQPVVGKHQWKILEVVDSDTIRVDFQLTDDNYPVVLRKWLVRVLGANTAEKGNRAECDAEKELSKKSMERVTNLITNPTNDIVIIPYHWDKFGGRFDAKVLVNGNDLAETLISEGLAQTYYGEKKESFCSIFDRKTKK